MVKSATNLTSNGLRDWLVQRVSAIVIGVYSIILAVFFISHPQLSFSAWHHFMLQPWMQIFTFITLFLIVLHAWIGIWIVLTDYVNNHGLRLLLQMLMVLALLGYLVWGAMIIWG